MLFQRICFHSETTAVVHASVCQEKSLISLIHSCYCAVFLHWIVALAKSF